VVLKVCPENSLSMHLLAELRPDQLQRVRDYIDIGVADVDNMMRIAQEEIFGPVLVAIPYTDEDDAIRIANDSEYGLSGGVWSVDTEHAMAIARRIRTGTVGINGQPNSFDGPFGGFKASGIGREHGTVGVATYTELQTITV
jgi:acyl-CoA reductase-like NAD-dependent aldehyde dehydrogenase